MRITIRLSRFVRLDFYRHFIDLIEQNERVDRKMLSARLFVFTSRAIEGSLPRAGVFSRVDSESRCCLDHVRIYKKKDVGEQR